VSHSPELLAKIYNWYYAPGEVVRSIGFYINPYKKWENATFDHIFAFDGEYNLYVGQYSVYPEHISKVFNTTDIREYGFLRKKRKFPVNYLEDHTPDLMDTVSVVDFEFLETKNILYLNKRLKRMSQRLYDYGMSEKTVVVSRHFDLCQPSLRLLTEDQLMDKPDREWLKQQIKSS